MKNHTAQTVRNWLGSLMLGLAPVRRAAANQLSELSIGYPGSPLNGDGLAISHASHGAPGPGQRVAPRHTADASANANESANANADPIGAAPRFALFATHGPEAEDLLRVHADLLEPVLHPPLGNAAIWLVRPDGYVATVAPAGEGIAIAAYLSKLRHPA
jgi:hypothetical protein